MKLITMNRDMRPWQAGHDYALPDDAADQLIAAGDAKNAAVHAATGLRPDAVAPVVAKPLTGYLTRATRAIRANAG